MKRRLLFAGIGLVGFLTVVLGGLLTIDAYHRAKAQQLVRDIQALRIGESSISDVQELKEKYQSTLLAFANPECKPPMCEEASFDVQSPLARGIDNYPVWVGRLGIHVWIVGGSVRLEEGKVSATSVLVFTRRPDSCWLVAGASLRRDISQKSEVDPDADYSDEHVERHAYNITGGLFHIDPEHGDILTAGLTPQASAAAREHAFDINWKCVGTLHGCRELCELYPGVWADWIADQQRRGADTTPYKGRKCAIPGGACICHGGCEDQK